MTRLTTEWISSIEGSMGEWNKTLKALTGYGLAELACRAADAPVETLRGKRAAVIPVTSGEGVIGLFAESVRAILNAIGMEADVTEHTDVSGIYEAIEKKYDMVILADDDRYIALNLSNGQVGENDLSTALGYLQLLEDCNRKQTGRALAGEPVLLMGYGRVGHIMYDLLKDRGAVVTVYDKDPNKQNELRESNIPQIADASEIANFRLIVDLTSEGDWIEPAWLREDLIMAAPGVPLSVPEEAAADMADRVIHDDLEIGTAVMAVRALREA